MKSDDLLVPDWARERQRRASDPGSSVWVSANAGSGKTKVLTDRVIRLLLAGSPPSRLLCLTFTKAAAAEMTIRVFETLGDWVTLDDPALSRALEGLTGTRPNAIVKARARRLFARAVETPGGLKIETIHAFCERLLHLVPFEAAVPARFTVLDDDDAAELGGEARAAVLAEASSGSRPKLAAALDIVTAETVGDPLIRLIDGAVASPEAPQDQAEIAGAAAALAAAFGLRAGETPDEVRREMVQDGLTPAEMGEIAAALDRTGKPKDADRAAALRAAAGPGALATRFGTYWGYFFTDKGGPRKDLATKGAGDTLRERLAAEQERLLGLRNKLLGAEALERTRALYILAAAVREKVLELKRRRGALDFADLITKTLALLERGAGPWVLYKLDRGIDHVLVDEAQDTNGAQWQILRRLTEEFTAGAGRPARGPRTVFAVGDPKQSIYSFQGADPRLFEDSRRHWTRLHTDAGLAFADVRLDLSFRSAPTVLSAVDHTFRVEANYRGLSFEDAAIGTNHGSGRPKAPGHLEVWPTERPSPAAPEPDAWSLAVDEPDRDLPAVVAAGRVARAIRHWTTVPDEGGRTWRPGEILILARRRGPAFFATIRALKAAGVPVAGADRLDINEQIAVNDLVAAGGAALLPQNDLVLAAALKSPLVGLDDDDLVRIAAGRPDGASLFDALAAAAAGDVRARSAHDTVSEWRRLAGALGPFGFYATLLGPMGGRRQLVERLGGEAADAVDVFLCRAQAEEFGPDAPSLTAFLSRFEGAPHVIKRDPEAAGDQVRVMTVHGAKGLEAPLVVVLDGCEVYGPEPRLLPVAVGADASLPVWALGASSDPPAVAAARAELKARSLEEHNRLLYVALTRARDRLVIVPYTNGNGADPPEGWCAMVRRGLEAGAQALQPAETPYGPVDLWREGGAVPARAAAAAPDAAPDLPSWLTEPVAPDPESSTLSPSSARPDLVRPRNPRPERGAETRSEARRRGVLIHALLHRLGAVAPDEREPVGAAFLEARAGGLGADERRAVLDGALRIVERPDLAALFGPGSRGEVPVAGRLGLDGAERFVSGQIDRLTIGPDRILLADFKTGTPPRPGTPALGASYLAQLALYRALLAAIHPGRPVRAVLVWTESGAIVEPTAAELDRAFADAFAALA